MGDQQTTALLVVDTDVLVPFLIGQGLEERLVHATLQEAELPAGAGIKRHELGDRLAMAGQHGRQVGLGLLNVDAAGGGGARWDRRGRGGVDRRADQR